MPFFASPPISPWHGEPTGVAQAYVHVFEVEIEASPVGNGASISWSITPFTGAVSGDVTPNHLMLRVSDGINSAVGGPYSGWSGSENWDGAWMGGGNWDGCGQVTISLEVAPGPLPARWGIPSIYVTDETCGAWGYYNQSPAKSIQFGCSGYSSSPVSSSDSGTLYGYCLCEECGLLVGHYYISSSYRPCVNGFDCIQTYEQFASVSNVTTLGPNCTEDKLWFVPRTRFNVGQSTGEWSGMPPCSNSLCAGPCHCSSIVREFNPAEIASEVENEFDYGIGFDTVAGNCVCAIFTDPFVNIPREE